MNYASNEILISPLGDVADNSIEHLLVDQIWPRILAHSGQFVLHAAGVSGPNGALLFVGQSGRGKSTLSASLHQRGFALLGDDAMVISADDGEAQCRAVYRSLRLFPDSIATLFKQPMRQSKVAHYSNKRNIHLQSLEQRDVDQYVEAIFFIGADTETVPAGVATISPADSCMRLVEHSFWLDPTDVAFTARKLLQASAIANAVPTYQLEYSRSYAKLGDLHEVIFSVLH